MAMWGGKTSNDTFNPLTAAHQQRQQLFEAYWNYYRGNHRKPLKVKAFQPDDNVIINLCRRVVNKGNAFLFGLPLTWDAEGVPDEAKAYVNAVLGQPAKQAMTWQELGMQGAVTGTAFMRIYPGDGEVLPRVVVLDSAMLDVVTNANDIDEVLSYRIIWQTDQGWQRHRIDLQADGTWLITEEFCPPNRQDWVIVNETPWPYQWAPVFYCQNQPFPRDVWGISDLEDADLNDAINAVASDGRRIIRYHASPKTIGTGFSAQQLQSAAIDDFWSIPDGNAKVYNLEMQSDLASTFQLLQTLKAAFSKTTGVPELDPAQVNIGALSGFALRILYGDLIELTSGKRNTYGELITSLISGLLELGGFGAGHAVTLTWQDAISDDAGAQAQLLALDRAQGVSLETYLNARGYDVDTELERIQEERAQNATLGEALLGAFERGAVQNVMGG